MTGAAGTGTPWTHGKNIPGPRKQRQTPHPPLFRGSRLSGARGLTASSAASYVAQPEPHRTQIMRLSEYLEPRHVVIDLRTHGVEDTIRTLVRRLEELGSVDDAVLVEKALIERESSHTTSLGNGVALPHATVPGLERSVILVGVAPDGLRFGSGDGEPDRLFFVLLSPLNQAGTHIKLLARIVRLVRRPGLIDTLLAAGSGDEVVDAIERVDTQYI